MDVGRPPGACHHLHQERRLVARPSRGVEEGLLGARRAELGSRTVERLAPRHAPEMRVTGAGENRKGKAAGGLELARTEPLEARQRLGAE